jgi:2-methylcitrate dehydratase PrpD
MRKRLGRPLAQAAINLGDPLGSVEELQLETRVMCSPGLEIELELALSLALAGSVGDDDLDHVILDHVANAAPAAEKVP